MLSMESMVYCLVGVRLRVKFGPWITWRAWMIGDGKFLVSMSSMASMVTSIYFCMRLNSSLAYLKLISNPTLRPVMARYPSIWAVWFSLKAETTLVSTMTF